MCFERTIYDYATDAGDPNVQLLVRLEDGGEVWMNGEQWVEGDWVDAQVIEFDVPDDVALLFDEEGLLQFVPNTFPEEWAS
jgi:hypothetical protein